MGRPALADSEHPRAKRRKPTAHRAIEHRVAHSHDDATENRRIHVEVRHNLFAEHARELLHDEIAIGVVRLARHRDGGMYSAFDLIDEIVIRARDLRDQHLSAIVDERLEEAKEVARQLRAVGLLHHFVLLLRADARRLENLTQPPV